MDISFFVSQDKHCFPDFLTSAGGLKNQRLIAQPIKSNWRANSKMTDFAVFLSVDTGKSGQHDKMTGQFVALGRKRPPQTASCLCACHYPHLTL
jgi:hypothetical protein